VEKPRHPAGLLTSCLVGPEAGNPDPARDPGGSTASVVC